MSNETNTDDSLPDEEVGEPRPENGHEPRGDDEPTIDDLGSDVEVNAEVADEVDEDDLLGGLQIDSTAEIEVPDRLVDQIGKSVV